MGIDPYGMESEILPHVGADAHIGPAGRTILTENTAFFRMTRVVFSIPSVGADNSVRPLNCFDFASDLRKNGNFLRADRVVRPYGAKSQFHGFAGKPP